MNALHSLKIATPCPMKWSQMAGDDRQRRCERCRLDVYNLSAMTEGEATELLTARQGSACVTFLRRADGTVLTQDCRGGFSSRFWEKFGAMQGTGLAFVLGAAFTAFFFAAVITLFGDNIRAMFGQGLTGALEGSAPVAKRVVKPVRPANKDGR